MTAYWLMKSEPDVFSIDALAAKGVAGWDGVRNYLARNNLRAMKKGDLAFFYHSNAKPSGIAGVMEIVREAYPDGGPLWSQVDVRFVERLPRPVSLDELRRMPALKGMTLLTHSRLSVQPVTAAQWKAIVSRSKRPAAP